MKKDDYGHRLDTLRRRVADLEARVGKDDAQVRDAVPVFLAEIKAVIEELHAAEKDSVVAFEHMDDGRRRHRELQQSHDALKNRIKKGDADLARAGDALQAEIHEHARTEADLAQRQAALEVVYRIATSKAGSMEAISERVVLNLSNLLNVPGAFIYRLKSDGLEMLTGFLDGEVTHEGDASLACDPWDIVCKEKLSHQYTGNLKERFKESACFQNRDFRSYIGVPVMDSTQEVTGILCAMDYEPRTFNVGEIHFVEILAKYVANEFEREVTERQLVESKRFQALGQLTSGVAHEVRNPINAILILAEALEASEYAHYLQRIQTQVNRLSNLMQDLLDLGKPLDLSHLEPLSLSVICAEAVELWRQSAAESRQTVRLVQPEDLPDIIVPAHAEKLIQVFINFIENAAQHSPEHSEILLSILPPEKNTVRVRVSDKGCGIPPENLLRVFDPFFTARKKGTGLGLSLAKQIVEAHQGEVAIWNNDPPPGCTVEVRLPAAKGKEA